MPVITEDRLARNRYSLAREKLVLCSVTLIGIAHTIRKHHGTSGDVNLETECFSNSAVHLDPSCCDHDDIREHTCSEAR